MYKVLVSLDELKEFALAIIREGSDAPVPLSPEDLMLLEELVQVWFVKDTTGNNKKKERKETWRAGATKI